MPVSGKLTSSEIRRVTDNYNETASLTWNRGSHEIKFGGEYRIQQLNDIQLDDSTGNYNFSQAFTSSNPFASSSTTGNDVASFLLGLPSSGTMGQGLYLALQRKYWAGFVQDRWKLTRTLTLNLGFRYEVEVPPTERHNYQSYFDFHAMAPIVQQAGLNNPGALLPVYQPDAFAREHLLSPGWATLRFCVAGYGSNRAARRVRHTLAAGRNRDYRRVQQQSDFVHQHCAGQLAGQRRHSVRTDSAIHSRRD